MSVACFSGRELSIQFLSVNNAHSVAFLCSRQDPFCGVRAPFWGLRALCPYGASYKPSIGYCNRKHTVVCSASVQSVVTQAVPLHKLGRRLVVSSRLTGRALLAPEPQLADVFETSEAEWLEQDALPHHVFDYLSASQALTDLQETLTTLGQVTEELGTLNTFAAAAAERKVTDAVRRQLERDLDASPEGNAGRANGSAGHMYTRSSRLQAPASSSATANSASVDNSTPQRMPTPQLVSSTKRRDITSVTSSSSKGLATPFPAVQMQPPTKQANRSAARSSRTASWGKNQDASTPPLGKLMPAVRSEKGAGDAMKWFLRSIGQYALLTADEEKVLAAKVQEMLSIQRITKDLSTSLGRAPSNKELASQIGISETVLASRMEQGNDAKRRMVNCNLRLVVSVAKKYINNGMSIHDLIAEGINGLTRGVEKFDPTKGFKFSTYAHWWIRQAVTRSISDQSRVVRVPVHLYELMSKLRRMERELSEQLNREPTKDELADYSGVAVRKIHNVFRAYKRPLSLEAPMKSDSAENGTLSDFIEDENQQDPEESAVYEMMKRDLENVLHTLSERECGILRLRYGLDDGQEKTLEEIGGRFKVTRERIRQIEAKAIRKLRHPSRNSILQDYTEGLPNKGRGRSVRSSQKSS